jgi:hypothetical protein
MTRLLEIATGIVFASAAAAKVLAGAGHESTTIVGSLGNGGRWALIAAELALAIWFFAGRGLISGSVAAVAMLSCFTAVLVCELDKPAPRDCGCFGNQAAAISDTQSIRRSLHWGIARNVGLMVGCGIVAVSLLNREERGGAV